MSEAIPESAAQQPADNIVLGPFGGLQNENNEDDDWTSTTGNPPAELHSQTNRREQNTRTISSNINPDQDILESDIRAEIQRFNQVRRLNSHTTTQQRRIRDRSQHPIIQPVQSSQMEIKQIICIGISVTILCGVALVLLRNKGKALKLVVLICLMSCIVHLYLKFQRIRQLQRYQIHENSYFSYSVSGNNRNPFDSAPREEDLEESSRNNSQARRNQVGRSSRNQNMNLIHSNQLFMQLIMHSLRQNLLQLGAAMSQERGLENGYTEEQINSEIKGMCKYSDLNQLLPNFSSNKVTPIDKINEKDDEWEITHKDDNTCVICLEGYGENSDVRMLKCKHFFHVLCLDEWLKKKKECPVCRQPPLVESPEEQQTTQQRQQNLQNLSSLNRNEILIQMSPQLLLGVLARQPIRAQRLSRIRYSPSQFLH